VFKNNEGFASWRRDGSNCQGKRKVAPASSMSDRSAVDQKPQKIFYSEGGEGGEGVRRKVPARNDIKIGFTPESLLGFLRSLLFPSPASL